MADDTPSGADRRQNFRIDESIHLDYRPLREGEAPPRLSQKSADVCRGLMQLRELTLQGGYALASIRKHHSDIAQYLSTLERKIELLSQITGAIALGDDITPNTAVNIGAGGMAFTTAEPFTDGQRLALNMVLFPSYLCLQLTAKVVYSRPQTQGGFTTGLEFEPLPESENDALIRHLLEKQSAQLREERENSRRP
ncbi:MAG: PilZ domain-containing protein [Pseudomonadota bacterium]